MQQFTIGQSGKAPKEFYSSAYLDLVNKWMMSVSRKGLLWYLPNKVPLTGSEEQQSTFHSQVHYSAEQIAAW